MPHALFISVRLHDGRYHGAGEWPPAPARLFQALVAGAGLSGPIEDGTRKALEWLERCSPPTIGVPRTLDGQSIVLYVPNNDLDKVGGDPRRIAEIRGATKKVKPRLFNARVPFLYAWLYEADEVARRHAPALCKLAERIYQFGRGVDFAWACAEVIDSAELEDQLLAFPGSIHRPSPSRREPTLDSPMENSLASLLERYAAYGQRFKADRQGKKTTTAFSKPPRRRFTPIAYESPPLRHAYELRRSGDDSFAPWPLEQVGKLVIWLRDGAVRRLLEVLPDRRADINRVLIGRKPDGSNAGPTSERVRILPLPSIGHPHADRDIRRVLIEVPASCPLPDSAVEWAFSGLELVDPDTGEVLDTTVVPTSNEESARMLTHYGIGVQVGSRRWRTVTAAVLPEARRRIEPTRRLVEAKGGGERCDEIRRAAGAVTQALRHAGIRSKVEAIRVQREPFEARGARVEAFAPGTRFPKERIWHVEVKLDESVVGPIVIGDGRFLGLGFMAPARGAGDQGEADKPEELLDRRDS